MARQLLFLCHANVMRSPAAELLAQADEGLTGSWGFASAGTHALVGHPVDHEMHNALAAYGIDAATRPGGQQLSAELVNNADLILAFEQTHRDFVARHFPEATRRTVTVRRAAELLANPPRRADGISLCLNDDRGYTAVDDFADPVGKGRAAAEEAAAEIKSLLCVILRGLGATT